MWRYILSGVTTSPLQIYRNESHTALQEPKNVIIVFIPSKFEDDCNNMDINKEGNNNNSSFFVVCDCFIIND